MKQRQRRGFTLLEVSVALALAALVLLTARALAGALGDSARTLRRVTAVHDARSNARALANTVLRNADVMGSDAKDFVGTEAFVAFSSWCASAGGWIDRCDATVVVEREVSRVVVALYLVGSPHRRLVIRDSLAAARFLYLESPGDGGEWLGQWMRPRSLPRAIGVATGSDTLILPVRS